MYNVPPRPQYPGGYQWHTAVTGLLAITLVSFVASAQIAEHYQYGPLLGDPLIRLGHVAVYLPFAWITWLFRLPYDPILWTWSGAALGGALLIVLLASAANAHRMRHLTDNTDDLHGSARWANREEIEATGMLSATGGVYVGGWYDEPNHRLHYLRNNGPEHILAFAPSRSGKGVSLVIPTLLAWEESAVIYDIKGENWAKTAGYRASQGHLCFKFSPVEEGSSSRFNPLAELRLNTPRDVSDAQNVAEMLIQTAASSPSEPYWQQAAASITTGMILHICYAAAIQQRRACLADLVAAFHDPTESFRAYLTSLLTYEHDPSGAQGWRTQAGRLTRTHPVVAQKVREMLNKEDKDFSGVLSAVVTPLALYADPLVAQNTAASDFRISDLVNHQQPVSLYIVVPPSDMGRLSPLVRILFTIIVNRLTEKIDFEGAQQVTRRHRLLFLIDEFPSLKRMELFSTVLSYMAGFGLKAYLISQDICQIEENYGDHQSLTSNCAIRIAFAPNNHKTAVVVSEMTGTRTIERSTVSYSGNRGAPALSSASVAIAVEQRPLLTPDEVGRIKPARKTGEGAAERIVGPGDQLIFAAGSHPIYGTQMLYFKDPELSRRAAIAPPTRMIRILPDGSVEDQLPSTRTEHVISPPEIMPTVQETLTFVPQEPVDDDDDLWIDS